MTVVVDKAGVLRRGVRWHHLAADEPEELHAFAAMLGLRPSWFHRDARHPHYDVTNAQRAKAIELGALDVDARTVVATARRMVARQASGAA